VTVEKNDLPKIPRGWTVTTLGDILGFAKGKKPKNLGSKSEVLSIPYIDIEAFEDKIVNRFTDGINCTLCDTDDLLVVWDGARCGLVGRGASGAIGSTLGKLAHYEMDSSYLFYFLQSMYENINKRPRGVGIPHVEPSIFWNISIPIPPRGEQKRIVARLEELFTRLDAGVEGLRKVKAQLNRYRQAVLKYAFEGKLVPQDPHDEPVTELLKKTRAEKEELARERKIRKEKSPPPISEEEMPFEVPKGWVWVRLIDLIALEKNAMKRGPFGGSLKKEIFVKKGYLVYEQRHAIHNDFNYEKYFITPQKYEEMIAFKVESGDLIISCSGVTLGKISEIPKNAKKGIINQALLKISLNNRLIRNDFFINFFNSDIYQKEIFEKAQGSAIPNMVGVDELKETLIVVPPLKEQWRIVSAVNYHFSLISNANKIVESGVRQSNQLRQAILKVAFAGELVSQNPNDEPAEKLLQRIKAERTSYWKSKIDNQLEMSRFVQ
jgi:type I restriction enzyme S subunit